MQNICYLDNSATTMPCKEAVDALVSSATVNWANPSSLYRLGIDAEQDISLCCESVAKKLSCRADEILFTSGGTEANNIAIKGAVLSRMKRGNRIVTTAFEHPSVFETVKSFEEKGFEVIYLKPDSNGKIRDEDIRAAINPNTILVSMMLVNNEIGSIQPIRTAADAIKGVNAPALLHTDAVQGFGKLPVKPSALGVDLLTASGHKIHSVKGIGFLYIKKGVHIAPSVFGGGQQKGIRPGTEPTPAIASLAAAVQALPSAETELVKISELNTYARTLLSSECAVAVNSPSDALPYILNISVEGFKSETLLHFLENENVFVSSGSACAKGALSPTLTAIGLSKSRIDSALRISFSRYNTKSDIDRLVLVLKSAQNKLKRIK